MVPVDAPPQTIDGAVVIAFADLSGVKPTGAARHFVRGEDAGDFFGLALARYDNDPGVYLLYCDADWRCVTDTYHDSVEQAEAQASREFGVVTFNRVDPGRQESPGA